MVIFWHTNGFPVWHGPHFFIYTVHAVVLLRVHRYVTELELEVRTGAPDGLVSWLGLDLAQEDYLGLGIDDGLVKVK